MFDVPALQIKQTSSQLEYEITAEDGRELGRATQVAGPKPRKGLFSMTDSGVGDSRVVLEVRDVHGTPLCFVDRQGGSPVAIVAPNGTVIGRFRLDWPRILKKIAEDSANRSLWRPALHIGSPPTYHSLVDAADRELGLLAWRLKVVRGKKARWVPDGGDYIDVNGVSIADLDLREAIHKDRYRLQFAHRPPEPLRTLVIASPLAYDLTWS